MPAKDLYYEEDGNPFNGFVVYECVCRCILFVHVKGVGIKKIILTSVLGMDGQGPKMEVDQYNQEITVVLRIHFGNLVK